MKQWIEVKARYDKVMENGAVKKVTEAYLVDAMSCTEAEARVIKELAPLSGDLSVTSATKTKISEVFQISGDKYYKVKYYKIKANYIRLDEKTGAEKKEPSYIIVPANSLTEAVSEYLIATEDSMCDIEIESAGETKYIDIYPYQAETDA